MSRSDAPNSTGSSDSADSTTTPASTSKLHPHTQVIAAGRPPRALGQPVNSPIVLTSTYFSHGEAAADSPLYARLGTESWLDLEEALRTLENASEQGLVFASGMAAISATQQLVPTGGTIIMPRHAYHAALITAHDLSERGVRVIEADITDSEAIIELVQTHPGAVLWLESPTNPMLEIADIAALTTAAHAHGGIVVVDNTFATPLAQKPLDLGADVVVHSVTKYLAGHSDVVLGAALTNRPDLYARLRRHRDLHGAIAGPFESWLALRGLRTLALRVERSAENARQLALLLDADPRITAVSHPSLPSHPQHDLAARQMANFGSIITIRPNGGVAAADALAQAVKLWLPATSLGGVESSLERRRRFASEAATVPEDLLRLSVGIEDVRDLWADLDQALGPII